MSQKRNTKKSHSVAESGFSKEEKSAMKARAQELKAEARANKNREEGEKAVFAAIAEMEAHDRLMAERLHGLITSAVPELMPKTWYGMPAYANTEGKVICFFQAASKFKVRYATFAFQHDANLDEGDMWATGFALVELSLRVEDQIIAMVKKAVG